MDKLNNEHLQQTPPRFGMESRGKNKDVNTRKMKELQKVKQQVENEKLKKAQEKKLKKNPPPSATQSPQPAKPKKQSQPNQQPTLVFGEDKDKESLYPQAQDYDDIDESSTIINTIFQCKKVGSLFHDQFTTTTITSASDESLDFQRAIQESLVSSGAQKTTVFVLPPTTDLIVKEMEEDFEILSDDLYSDDEDEDDNDIDDNGGWCNSIQPTFSKDELENWELLSDEGSTALVHLIKTPYQNSEKDFPFLSPNLVNGVDSNKNNKQQQHKMIKDVNNPWNQTKTLIDAIIQNS